MIHSIIWEDRVFLDNGKEVSAATDLYSGKIQLSKSKLKDLPKNWVTFIIEHEKAHYYKQTLNEIACDAHAFYECVKLGIPLEDLIKAISRVLDFESSGSETLSWKRFYAQEERALRIHNLRKQHGV